MYGDLKLISGRNFRHLTEVDRATEVSVGKSNQQAAISLFAENLSRYPTENGLPYLANVPSGSHLALFWENPETARMVEYWYIIHGLVKGEHCIYTTHGDPDEVRNHMAGRGMDVQYYEKERGLLHILQIDDPMDDLDGLTNGVGKVCRKIFANTNPPYRIVSRWIRDVYSEEGKKANMEVEVTCHKGYLGELPLDNPYSMFKNFPGSMICHYPVDQFNAKTHADWIRNHLSSHHVAVYVPGGSAHFKVIRL
jgi:hypothetical protein